MVLAKLPISCGRARASKKTCHLVTMNSIIMEWWYSGDLLGAVRGRTRAAAVEGGSELASGTIGDVAGAIALDAVRGQASVNERAKIVASDLPVATRSKPPAAALGMEVAGDGASPSGDDKMIDQPHSGRRYCTRRYMTPD